MYVINLSLLTSVAKDECLASFIITVIPVIGLPESVRLRVPAGSTSRYEILSREVDLSRNQHGLIERSVVRLLQQIQERQLESIVITQ